MISLFDARGKGRQALFCMLVATIMMMSGSVFVSKVSASVTQDGETGTGTLQSYVDDETGEIKTFDNTKHFSVEHQ